MAKEIQIICQKCGKQPEVDEKRSTKNWKRFKTFKNTNESLCHCGGKYKFKLA